jgi:CDP-glycerol glycerophosphotransferase (TagB/SpsB family)
MFDWLAQTVRSMADVPDTTLVIRVHPAEVRWGTNQPVERELLARVGTLPPNVRLVRPDEPISSYTLMAISDAVLTYTTTVGLEAAARGRPVAVAGATHYRGRGFTIDVDEHADVERLLRAATPLDAPTRELARRYAHGFFLRFMIPFPAVRIRDGELAQVPSDPADVAPGHDPYLDFVCDRILDGQPFVLPDELAVTVA